MNPLVHASNAPNINQNIVYQTVNWNLLCRCRVYNLHQWPLFTKVDIYCCSRKSISSQNAIGLYYRNVRKQNTHIITVHKKIGDHTLT